MFHSCIAWLLLALQVAVEGEWLAELGPMFFSIKESFESTLRRRQEKKLEQAKMMKEMADWADARNDRSLVFVIPPTIVEMQNTISVYGLASLDLSLRRKLANLAPVIDFDFPNAKTSDVNNFSDAYHFNSKLARQIVAEVLMVQGAEDKQAKTIAKRRSGVECPTQLQLQAVPSTSEGFVEGDACRVWIGKNNG